MRISRSFVYAAEALTQLARQPAGATLSATQMADGGGVSSRFLLHVLRLLVEAGILTSRKGPSGGYTLARPPAEISLLEVLEAVEGKLHFSADDEGRFDEEAAGVLEDATQAMRRSWAEVTLERLAHDEGDSVATYAGRLESDA